MPPSQRIRWKAPKLAPTLGADDDHDWGSRLLLASLLGRHLVACPVSTDGHLSCLAQLTKEFIAVQRLGHTPSNGHSRRSIECGSDKTRSRCSPSGRKHEQGVAFLSLIKLAAKA